MSANLKAVTTCMGYQQITSLSSAANLTVPVTAPNGLNAKPVFALIVCEGQGIRWRDDKTAPTASIGDLINIQFIEQVAGAKLNISYYV